MLVRRVDRTACCSSVDLPEYANTSPTCWRRSSRYREFLGSALVICGTCNATRVTKMSGTIVVCWSCWRQWSTFRADTVDTHNALSKCYVLRTTSARLVTVEEAQHGALRFARRPLGEWFRVVTCGGSSYCRRTPTPFAVPSTALTFEPAPREMTPTLLAGRPRFSGLGGRYLSCRPRRPRKPPAPRLTQHRTLTVLRCCSLTPSRTENLREFKIVKH